MKPVHLIIGHRGVGKSTWLKWLVGAGARGIDLDQEIARISERPIADLLNEDEGAFRRLENDTLAKLCQTDQETWIAVGAGIEKIPDDVHVLWLRRSTDSYGRTFLNRPRLNANLSPYKEFMERFSLRERRYKAWAQEEVWLPEGYEGGLEEVFLGGDFAVPFDLTLLPENFKNWREFWRRRGAWGLRRIELRDDLLTPAQINEVLKNVPQEKIIFGRRSRQAPTGNIVAPMDWTVDWALELGTPPETAQIVSLHERGADLLTAINHLSATGAGRVQKLAVEIKSFAELLAGHSWWLEDQAKRAFLPRSATGRWRWYRNLFGPRMPVHYFREGNGSATDQPYLWEAIHLPRLNHHFAAVLGSPVDHSRSPLEHFEFFKAQGLPFVAVDIREDEWASAWPALEKLGLAYVAVTAPLKKRAAEVAPEAGEEGLNTLWHTPSGWRGANTDLLALEFLAEELSEFKKIWVWGAGAVSSSVKRAFPGAQVISARQGIETLESPDLLIWATGRGREFKWPPTCARPRLVLDLNYADDSPGLEWAVTHGLNYQSGLQMFKKQAEGQRKLWRK